MLLPMAIPTVDYYLQSEAARMLGWSKQLMWWSVRNGHVSYVRTLGKRPGILIPAKELARLSKGQK